MPPSADILIQNSHVFTAQPARPFAQAVAVHGNRIAFVGSQTEAQAWIGPATRLIDGGGCSLLPGFIDSHYHLVMSSLLLDDIHLEDVTTYEEAVALIRDYATGHPEKEWLSGAGLHYDLGPGHIPLTRQHLDAIVAERPVFIVSYCGHTAWANTLALEKAGVLHGGECEQNSQIVLDEHGVATGELREKAMTRVEDLLPVQDLAEKKRLLKKGLELTSRMGITSVHEMDGNDEQAALLQDLEGCGELTVRVRVPYSYTPEKPIESLELEAVPMRDSYHSAKLRSNCVKLFMDGVLESYTALLVEPYADDPSTHGNSNYSVTDFNRVVVEADRLGLQIFVHAIGDLGVRRVLDAYALAQRTNGKRDSRHRVEHIEVIHPEDVKRFAALGVIASMQPLHAPLRSDEADPWLWRAGRARWPYSFAWATLRQAGARLVFGSDWNVVSHNPLLGIYAALNRLPWAEGLPDQRQSLADTLLSYTHQAAYAEFQEHQKGQIKPGYLADMVLLSKNLFSIPPEQIKDVLPRMTIMDGRIVFE
jgi:predicted amidohydrolase YtcJ